MKFPPLLYPSIVLAVACDGLQLLILIIDANL